MKYHSSRTYLDTAVLLTLIVISCSKPATIIDAGAQGAFGNFSPGENGSIAVIATDGTVKSGAYPETIKAVNRADGQEETIHIVQQAGIGIAEAIDESADAIDRKATTPRQGYKGPSDTGTGEMKVDPALWDRYDFDLENGAMLWEGDATNPHNIQINSVENYIAFHVVTLEDGSFTYEYKYGRQAGDIQEYVKVVPFSRTSIPDDIHRRLSHQVPAVYEMMVTFNRENPKTEYLIDSERIVRE